MINNQNNKAMMNLKQSVIKGNNCTFYEIPNTDKVMIAVYKNGDITLVGWDNRNLWFALGDRDDLKPTKMKDWKRTSYRPSIFTEKETREEFISRVLNIFEG